MKKFTKLALATSVALSANAMAMQAMDDASLSATTGQDGLTIGIGISQIAIEKLYIHDTDGLTYPTGTTAPIAGQAGFGGTGKAGAIVIYGTDTDLTDDKITAALATNAPTTATHGVVIGANYDDNNAYLLDSKNLVDLTIDSDAGNGNPFINIGAAVSGLDIKIGKIGITASGAEPTAASTSIRRGGGTVVNEILSGLEVKTGKMNANIQLGSAPQGAMIKLDTVMIGGLEIKNLGIVDNSTKGYEFTKVDVPKRDTTTGAIIKDADGNIEYEATNVPVTTREAGEIFIESIKIADAKGKNLTLKQNISVYNDAYVGPLPSKTVGKPAHVRIVSQDTGPKDQYIKGIHLGNRNAKSIGDMEVQGLQTWYSPAHKEYTKGAVITISGH